MRHNQDYALAVATLLVCSSAAVAVDPGERTADLPDSWLVLYNLNSADSIEWAHWYQQERGIPDTHLLGLNASLDEHLPDLAAVQAQVVGPVRTLLASNPELTESIMGILLGYGLPGHYANPPLNPSIGGFSVSDALQDMTDDGLAPSSQKGTNTDNPHMTGNILPPTRKTRANMAANRYMVARIDAPNLAAAKALTIRAKVLEHPSHTLHGQSVWFDYHDPGFPSSNREWYWLRSAVQNAQLADLPWSQFDLQVATSTPGDAFRFDVYRLYDWHTCSISSEEPGSQVLCFDFNSWGAVTVRSLTGNGGVYVPNVLAAGYAAAIGATGEPQCCVGPFPDTLLASLREGWTLGEAFYLANPFNDWMWTLVGDPFLTVPNWFDPPSDLPGDVNGDGVLDSRDLAAFNACMAGPAGANPAICITFDLDGDGDLDLEDFAALQEVLRGSDVQSPNPDFDGDGDVDWADFEALTACLSGAGPGELDPGCEVFDADYDLDVDLSDYAGFRLIVANLEQLP